jgi:hypothetical protein
VITDNLIDDSRQDEVLNLLRQYNNKPIHLSYTTLVGVVPWITEAEQAIVYELHAYILEQKGLGRGLHYEAAKVPMNRIKHAALKVTPGMLERAVLEALMSNGGSIGLVPIRIIEEENFDL